MLLNIRTMADPISLLAIGALVYTGRKMSEPETETRSDPTKYEPPVKPPLLEDIGEEEYPEFEDGPPTWQGKEEVSNFGVVAPQQKSSGAEVLNLRGRFDAGRHNNLSPIEKQLVGPGLGLSPDMPASGGFQQLYRINPINVGSYRLTTLPGRAGHGHDTTGGRQSVPGRDRTQSTGKDGVSPRKAPDRFRQESGL